MVQLTWDWPKSFSLPKGAMNEKRAQHVGVKMTRSEAEALRRAAFEERTTKSSLLRRLFVERYLKRGHQRQETE